MSTFPTPEPVPTPEPAPEALERTGSAATGQPRQLTFTSSQAARYLGVSLATIRRWTDAGHIACYRTPGGQRRFSRDQLDGFIASLQDAQGDHSRRAA
jgi:excisionase family DNA binding protein